MLLIKLWFICITMYIAMKKKRDIKGKIIKIGKKVVTATCIYVRLRELLV